MNAVTTSESNALAPITEKELIDVLQTSLYPGAALPSIKMVLGYCKAAQLDPMRKPVHIVPMWDGKAKQMRDVVMPGIGLYRTDASRTDEHVGTDEPVFGPMVDYDLSGTLVTVPEWCKVTVYRLKNGVKCAFTATEYWIENYATAGKDTAAPNAMWKKRARGQLSKCAEAQALRKGFPEVGNQPTADEMEGKTIDMGPADVVGTPPPPPPPPAATQKTWTDAEFLTPARDAKIKEFYSKGKTIDEILAFYGAKAALTDSQVAHVRKLKPVAAATPAGDVQDATVKVTYAALLDKFKAATTADALDEAATLIAALPADQQAEATTHYETRRAELA